MRCNTVIALSFAFLHSVFAESVSPRGLGDLLQLGGLPTDNTLSNLPGAGALSGLGFGGQPSETSCADQSALLLNANVLGHTRCSGGGGGSLMSCNGQNGGKFGPVTLPSLANVQALSTVDCTN
ncbi:hypothetical protein PGT21_028872 [Puccinia graminis f. sp. tritici]|uniref:Hydrophobin n=1 Tax=Puccinia graminis f. sp. tritici TaxID=56615 RepID=A0A5B0LQI3_PUCGR|nr:hypothetical protein PGT21_028872 [Puccinia graminis f. sp. tritici]KAA1128331.1 hypothetical protein PGTUg99_009459 [Puccinia graminis f. sp. tritici]